MIVTGVMRPDCESPLMAADEVGVEARDANIVQRLRLTSVEQVIHTHPCPVLAEHQIADLQLVTGQPTLPGHEERVFRAGGDYLVTGMEMVGMMKGHTRLISERSRKVLADARNARRRNGKTGRREAPGKLQGGTPNGGADIQWALEFGNHFGGIWR